VNKNRTFLLLIICGTLFLLPNFYQNRWSAVDETYYSEWQARYDRLVVARLAKNHQDGFFSAGGLLGLGDATEWNFLSETHRHQFDTYIRNGEFKSYLVYKSNPGFQGVFYGVMDKLLGDISGERKIQIFRGVTTFLSALAIGLIFAFIATELGSIAGLSMLVFSAFSTWTILPAGSIFWNLWAFYLPFLAGIYLLRDSAQKGQYKSASIYIFLFIATLIRILLSGFDLMTTGLIMTTVPFVYYGAYELWDKSTFITRFIKASSVLILATVTGLMIMSVQIASTDHTVTNVFSYIEERFGHHFAGNSEYYISGGIEATKIGAFEITSKYLAMPAVNIPWPGEDLQILYWHLVVLFVLFTVIYFLTNRNRNDHSRKAIALITATWYSLSAPLSWILIFRPHSIIHTHVNTMGWQMPFTFMGFALCGYVVTDLFRRKST